MEDNLDHLDFLETEAACAFFRMVKGVDAKGRWEEVDLDEMERRLNMWMMARVRKEQAKREKEERGREVKKPKPDEAAESMEEYCTCNDYEWGEQICPYSEEINDKVVFCNCCPHCYRKCLDDI